MKAMNSPHRSGVGRPTNKISQIYTTHVPSVCLFDSVVPLLSTQHVMECQRARLHFGHQIWQAPVSGEKDDDDLDRALALWALDIAKCKANKTLSKTRSFVKIVVQDVAQKKVARCFSNKMDDPFVESGSNPNLENLLGDNKKCWRRKNAATSPPVRLVDSLFVLFVRFNPWLLEPAFCCHFLNECFRLLRNRHLARRMDAASLDRLRGNELRLSPMKTQCAPHDFVLHCVISASDYPHVSTHMFLRVLVVLFKILAAMNNWPIFPLSVAQSVTPTSRPPHILSWPPAFRNDT